ncbi:unnamed protein product [Vicia faba]|uniref:Uncharacterized protein n=1 Tax=Vicia faba TaxID=3906 RepID=A0AAV0ZWU5_VICFA|nr:unnamed protein product [Vicia faba]
MDATQVANDVEVPIADAIFLNNLWDNLAELGEKPIPNEDVFTSAISNLKKNQFARKNWYVPPLCLNDDAPTMLDDQTVSNIMVNGLWDLAKSSTNIPLFIQQLQ